MSQATAPHQDHVVQFYDIERDRVDAVVDYLIDGIAQGREAMFIVTREHLEAIEKRLDAFRLDPDDLRASGVLTTIDAESTLASFNSNGRLDRGKFDAAVSSFVEQVRAAQRPAMIYGEMVTLLWAAGHVTAALELETFWNEALEGLDASVFCAYPMSLLASAPRESLAGLYHVHTDVLGRSSPIQGDHAGQLERRFAAEPMAPAKARRFAVDVLRLLGQEERAQEVSIVVSELASNAVLHARSPFIVGIGFGEADGRIRVTVSDDSQEPPLFGHGALPDETGRGLALLDALASRWGVTRTPDGKRVWVDLAP